MSDLVGRLRRACGYQNIDERVRGFLSEAPNGLVLDAADEIERLQNDFSALQTALVGNSGLSAIQEAHKLRALHPLGARDQQSRSRSTKGD